MKNKEPSIEDQILNLYLDIGSSTESIKVSYSGKS
jgi:hypothetical protein